HYLPAMIEAAQSYVPMIAVTADRPWELYDAAAPQTIDQAKMFGDFLRHYAELGLPDARALRAVPRIAAQSVARTLGPTPGPVTSSARLRRPLEPVAVAGREPWEDELEGLLRAGAPRVVRSELGVDQDVVRALAERCARAERGLVVFGPSIGLEGE